MIVGRLPAGLFSFFFFGIHILLGLFLFGEKKLGHAQPAWFAAFFVFLGSWLSGYLIVATDAWMQHPTGYRLTQHGEIELSSFWGLILNPWALWHGIYTIAVPVRTASCFVMAAVGALYLLTNLASFNFGKTFYRCGRGRNRHFTATCSLWGFFRKDGLQYQPTTLAAMEGLFESRDGAAQYLVSRTSQAIELENPLVVSAVGVFLTYRHWNANVHGFRMHSRRISGQTESTSSLPATTCCGWPGHHLHRRSWRFPRFCCGAENCFSRTGCSGSSCFPCRSPT